MFAARQQALRIAAALMMKENSLCTERKIEGGKVYGRITVAPSYKGLGHDSVAPAEQAADAAGLVSVLSRLGKGAR